MHQPLLPTFEIEIAPKIVNVASLPHYSPFRYPGGKTWLIPQVRQWLNSLPVRPQKFVEPFAGGASVGLTVVFERLAEHVLLVELDEQVGAVWQCIIEENQAQWLTQAILSFPMTPEGVDALLAESPNSLGAMGLQTIVRNRVNRGGILAPGAGRLKSGENGKGIRSRWYPETLARRILAIDQVKDRLSFQQSDGLATIGQYAETKEVAFFVDPPYTVAGTKPGRRLYTHSQTDHAALFKAMAKVKGAFLMTYQDDTLVHDLANHYEFSVRSIPMKTTHHRTKIELLISRDLSWLGSSKE